MSDTNSSSVALGLTEMYITAPMVATLYGFSYIKRVAGISVNCLHIVTVAACGNQMPQEAKKAGQSGIHRSATGCDSGPDGFQLTAAGCSWHLAIRSSS